MAWQHIDDCGLNRRTVYRMVERGEVPSKTDEQGRRLVWLAPERDLLRGILSELAELRAAVTAVTPTARPAVTAVSQGPRPAVTAVTPTATRPVTAASPTAKPDATRDISRGDLLELLGRVWTGSDGELERRAGVPQGWCCKQRKNHKAGKGDSVRGRPARLAVLAVLEAEQKADTSAQPAAADSIAA